LPEKERYVGSLKVVKERGKGLLNATLDDDAECGDVAMCFKGRDKDQGCSPKQEGEDQSASREETPEFLQQVELGVGHRFCTPGVRLDLVESLIFPEVRNGKSKRVDLNEVVANGVPEGKDNMRRVLRAFDLAAVER